MPDDELRASLDLILGKHLAEKCTVTGLRRHQAIFSTCSPLEELLLDLSDGSRLRILFKNVDPGASIGDAARVRPPFMYDPAREIAVYRHVLAGAGLGTASYYGSDVASGIPPFWLFLELVEGWQLFEVDEDQWWPAARWLAKFHGRFVHHPRLAAITEAGRLLQHDRTYYELWKERVSVFTKTYAPGNADGAALAKILRQYDLVVDRLMRMPQGVIHGEFVASNVLVAPRELPSRVCPIDWETAALGPLYLDVAALIAGDWSPEKRLILVEAYSDALPSQLRPARLDTLLADLNFCRLHLALRWFAWSPNWTAPPAHRRNWLAEAVEIGEEIGLC